MQELAARYGLDLVQQYMGFLQDYAEQMVRALIRQMPRGTYTFRDYMDDDGFGTLDIPIVVTVHVDEETLTL